MAAGARDQDGIRSALGVDVHAGGAARRRDGCRRDAAGARHRHDSDEARRKRHQHDGGRSRHGSLSRRLDKVQAAGLSAQISVKPTQLGLDLDKELCFKNLLRLIERADRAGNLVWIDMRLAVCRSDARLVPARACGVAARRIALQAYLSYRMAADVESLVPLGVAIRLVKGAYLEPPSAVKKLTSTRRQAGVRLLADDAGVWMELHIATHDPRLADRSLHSSPHRCPGREYDAVGIRGRFAAPGRAVRCVLIIGDYGFRGIADSPSGRDIWFVVRTSHAVTESGTGDWGTGAGGRTRARRVRSSMIDEAFSNRMNSASDRVLTALSGQSKASSCMFRVRRVTPMLTRFA